MFCTQCGTQNDDTNRFCTRCGQSLTPISQADRAEPVQRPSQVVSAHVTPGSLIAVVASAIALIGFFLPWVSAACSNTQWEWIELHDETGLALAMAGELPCRAGHYGFLLVVPLAACFVLVVSYLDYVHGRMRRASIRAQMVASFIGLVAVFVSYGQFYFWRNLAWGSGIRATVLGLVGVLVGSLLNLADLRRQGLVE